MGRRGGSLITWGLGENWPAKGLPLIFHGGTPTGALLFPPLVEEATRRGLWTVV